MDFSKSFGRGPAPPAGTKSSVNYSRVPMDEDVYGPGKTEGRGKAPRGSNDAFITGQQQLKRSQLSEQNNQLSALAESASRLGDLSLVISDEIGQQNRMLDEMETDLDKASDLMDVLRKKTKKLVEKSGGSGWFTLIVILGIIIVILFVLVVYT